MCGALSPPFDSGMHFLQLRYEALPLWHARVFSTAAYAAGRGAGTGVCCTSPARLI